MEKDTTYVALDDSNRKIVVGILRSGDTQPELREIANDPRQIRRRFERLKREGPVAACYEAGVSGYDLHRQLIALGVAGAVIAPALTPRRPGQRIKTDRRDAAKLVRLFRAGELTAIHVLDESEEAVRDLVRCRDDIRRDVLRWRHRVLKLLARHGRACLTGKNWSRAHWQWIREQRFDLPPLQRAFEATLFALEQARARQAELDKELEAVAATASYREPVGGRRPGVAGPAALASPLPPSRRPRQANAGGRGGGRARTGGVHLGRHDSTREPARSGVTIVAEARGPRC